MRWDALCYTATIFMHYRGMMEKKAKKTIMRNSNTTNCQCHISNSISTFASNMCSHYCSWLLRSLSQFEWMLLPGAGIRCELWNCADISMLYFIFYFVPYTNTIHTYENFNEMLFSYTKVVQPKPVKTS